MCIAVENDIVALLIDIASDVGAFAAKETRAVLETVVEVSIALEVSAAFSTLAVLVVSKFSALLEVIALVSMVDTVDIVEVELNAFDIDLELLAIFWVVVESTPMFEVVTIDILEAAGVNKLGLLEMTVLEGAVVALIAVVLYNVVFGKLVKVVKSSAVEDKI